jgi:hypothetical protein
MATYSSQYPPAQNATYVVSTTDSGASFKPYFATDPTKSLTGTRAGTSWASDSSGAPPADTNQRFHIDLGSGFIIRRIYYENGHNSGISTDQGGKNFTFWGSNTASAFSDVAYTHDTNWTQLTLASSVFSQHIAADQADPNFILVTNTTAYRYYAFKIADNYGGTNFQNIRRFELQTEDGFSLTPKPITLSQLERDWFHKNVSSSQNTTPIDDLKRAYYKTQGAIGFSIGELEQSWLAKKIVSLGGAVVSSYPADLWAQLVGISGLRVSRRINENKMTYYINT